jgi:hypothetical protein
MLSLNLPKRIEEVSMPGPEQALSNRQIAESQIHEHVFYLLCNVNVTGIVDCT